MKSIILLFYLILLSVFDWRERRVPVILLAAGVALATGWGLHTCFYEMENLIGNLSKLCFGLIPGCILILLAWLTRKVGYGDGIALLTVGMILGYQNCFALLCFSMLLAAVISGIMLLARRVNKYSALPYLPFLTVTYLAGILIGGKSM